MFFDAKNQLILARFLIGLAFVLAFGMIPGSPFRPVLLSMHATPMPNDNLARDGSLFVHVHDESGNPIAHADMVALTIVNEKAFESGSGASNELGDLKLTRLPNGEMWILANADGHARASSHFILVGEREVDLVLGAEHVFDVDVRDPDGNAIPMATIEARSAEPLGLGARTNDRGHARVNRLGAGPWSVTIHADGFENQTMRAKDNDTLLVTLRRLGSITVTVLDPSGNNAPNALVQIAGSALWPAREGKTGEKGMVKLAGLYAGSYALRATRGTDVSPTEFALTLGAGENKDFELRLEAGRMVPVETRVSDEDDADAITAARVVLTEGGVTPFPLEAVTDAHGHATLGPIASGLAFVSARAETYVARSGVPVPIAINGYLKVVLAKAGSIAGRVVDARGFPIAGATLEIVGNDFMGGPIDDDPKKSLFRDAHFDAVLAGPSPLITSGELGVVPGAVPAIPRAGSPTTFGNAAIVQNTAAPWITKRDGTFELDPATPGRVRVIVRHPEFVETMSESVTLTPGGRVDELTVIMNKGGELDGRVLDASGKSISGARLEIASARGSFSRVTQTATDGTFVFSSLPPSCVIDVYEDDDALHAALRVAITVAEGSKTTTTITLPKAREALAVTVKDERGYAISAAQLTLLSLDPSVPIRETAFTDDHGEATLARSVGLSARIEVRAPLRAPKSIEVAPVPTKLDVALDPAISVRGEVRDSGSNQPPIASVALYTDNGPKTVLTGNDGSFQLDELAPGVARLVIRSTGSAAFERTITLTPSTNGRPLDLGLFELTPEAVIEGRVVDSRNDPVMGARVALDHAPVFLAAQNGLPSGVAISDSKGRFRLVGLAEGNLTLEAYAPDLGIGHVTVKSLAGRTTHDVTLTLTQNSAKSAISSASGGVAITLGETNSPREVVVVAITTGSEAERAGLQTDDTIVAVDGAPVSSIEDARAHLNGPVEQDVVVKIRRASHELTLRFGREAVRR